MVSGHRPVVCLVTGYIEQGMSLARNLTLSDSVGVFFRGVGGVGWGGICRLQLTYFES